MQITHHLTVDLARPLPAAPIGAVQGDGCTRTVKLSLLENGTAWEVPEGVTAAVAFRKPDKTKGLYDTLPDGTKAVTIDGSTAAAVLAPQALRCPGMVSAAVVFYDGMLNQLATFPFGIRVERNPAAEQEISNDYYRYSTMEAVSEAVEAALAAMEESRQDFLTKAEQALAVVHDTAAADAPAIVCQGSGEVIAVADASDRPLQNLIIYGKTTQDGTPAPESPAELESVGESGTVTATVCGKNLLNYENLKSYYGNALETSVDSEGYITITNTTSSPQHPQQIMKNYRGKLYSHIEIVSNDSSAAIYVANADADYSAFARSTGITTITKEVDGYFKFQVSVQSGASIKFRAIVSTDPNAKYEPFKEPQTLTVSTPNGLPGIPVASGGNYTDADGQQWICDEVDFARGVYVQRIGRKAFTELVWRDNWNAAFPLDGTFLVYAFISGISKKSPPAMSTHFRQTSFILTSTQTGFSFSEGDTGSFGIRMPDTVASDLTQWNAWCEENGACVIYALGTPIETALTAEELAAYAALQSYKPSTTVYNDAGAGMKLGYVADTKTYIDQKISAISAAMLA